MSMESETEINQELLEKLRPQGVPSFEQDREQAATVFQLIVVTKNKEKQVNALGLKVCAQLKIDPDSLLSRKLDFYTQLYADPEVAELHY